MIEGYHPEQIIIELKRYTCKICGQYQVWFWHTGNPSLIEIKCKRCNSWFFEAYNREQEEVNIEKIKGEMI